MSVSNKFDCVSSLSSFTQGMYLPLSAQPDNTTLASKHKGKSKQVAAGDGETKAAQTLRLDEAALLEAVSVARSKEQQQHEKITSHKMSYSSRVLLAETQ